MNYFDDEALISWGSHTPPGAAKRLPKAIVPSLLIIRMLESEGFSDYRHKKRAAALRNALGIFTNQNDMIDIFNYDINILVGKLSLILISRLKIKI